MTPAKNKLGLLPAQKCDMCDGTGLIRELRMKDGSMIWMTTSAEANEWIYQAEQSGETISVEVTCRTCDGSGILPEHLKPEYWR